MADVVTLPAGTFAVPSAVESLPPCLLASTAGPGHSFAAVVRPLTGPPDDVWLYCRQCGEVRALNAAHEATQARDGARRGKTLAGAAEVPS